MKKIIYILPLCLLFFIRANAQTAAADNKIQESITFSEPPRGPGIYGIFEGRSPCYPISRMMGATMPADCDHLKWQLILFQDSVTKKPTTFILRTEMFDRRPLTGKWIVKNSLQNSLFPTLIELDWGQPGKTLCLMKGSENVLFIVDEHLDFMNGDQYWSYTLNRVKKVMHLTGQ